MTEEEKQKQINDILSNTLNKDEINNYNELGSSLGIMYGLLYSLEEEGILKAFGEEGITKIKKAMEIVTGYTQKGIELELTKEKVEKIRKDLLNHELV